MSRHSTSTSDRAYGSFWRIPPYMQALCGLFFLGTSTAAVGQTPAGMLCGGYGEMVEALQLHGETRQVVGSNDNNGFLLEMWGNSQTRSWTVAVVMPDGTACIAAIGHSYEIVTDEVGPDDPGA